MSDTSHPQSSTPTQRVHVVLAHAGIASRRKAEELVSQGRVHVNGVQASLGQAVGASDAIAVDGVLIERNPEHFRYFLVNKPTGFVSTVSDEMGRPSVLSLLPESITRSTRLYPVGRLDIDSQGLLVITNDGPLTHRLTHPKYTVSKTYDVQLDRRPSDQALMHLERGVQLIDGRATPDDLVLLDIPPQGCWFSITVHEGRNRLVRRMFERVGYEVITLIRTQFGPWSLDTVLQLAGEKPWIELQSADVPQFIQ